MQYILLKSCDSAVNCHCSALGILNSIDSTCRREGLCLLRGELSELYWREVSGANEEDARSVGVCSIGRLGGHCTDAHTSGVQETKE